MQDEESLGKGRQGPGGLGIGSPELVPGTPVQPIEGGGH